jgi:hypothetical protein
MPLSDAEAAGAPARIAAPSDAAAINPEMLFIICPWMFRP